MSEAPEVVQPASGDAFDESPLIKIRRLERALSDTRRHAFKATQQLHRALVRELREAERRADRAEKRAARAEAGTAKARQRARHAEGELERIRSSSTWKAGRVVVAVPARVIRRRRS